jgi:3-hydroxyacyl-[acyl-carrier-protein] dehydratase
MHALPHGPEFRFVDLVTQLEPGVSASAEFTLKGSEEFLRGHFPGQPIFPGVLMIEALAQLAGIAAQCDPVHPALANLRLTAVRGVKILGTVGPQETMTLAVKIVGRLGNLISAEGSVHCGEQILCQGQVTLSGDAPS